MRLAHQYRLRPTVPQQAMMESWLELLRRQYNYRLAERFNWWEQNRCDVNACPSGTSQDCSDCGEKVSKTLADRWHSCPHCGAQYDRDHNAARNIKLRAVGHPVQALRGHRNTEPTKREAYAVS